MQYILCGTLRTKYLSDGQDGYNQRKKSNYLNHPKHKNYWHIALVFYFVVLSHHKEL